MSTDGDPDDVSDATASFLAEYDDGDCVLETVLAIDVDHETWTFDDVDLDSGTVGELVSRGIVTKANGAYQVAEPAVVESVLTGEDLEAPVDDTGPAIDLDQF